MTDVKSDKFIIPVRTVSDILHNEVMKCVREIERLDGYIRSHEKDLDRMYKDKEVAVKLLEDLRQQNA